MCYRGQFLPKCNKDIYLPNSELRQMREEEADLLRLTHKIDLDRPPEKAVWGPVGVVLGVVLGGRFGCGWELASFLGWFA